MLLESTVYSSDTIYRHARAHEPLTVFGIWVDDSVGLSVVNYSYERSYLKEITINEAVNKRNGVHEIQLEY